MSNETQKADQIAFHLYTKLFYVVNHARATTEPRVQPKTDKWFNLETPDSDLFTKDVRDKYRFISTYPPPPPPLEIQVLLSIPELTNNQVLVYLSPDSSRVRIEPTPRHIVLESWVLSFTPRDIDEEDGVDVAPPTIYKHGIPLFRSLFSLLRILPAWKLYKRLRRRTGVAKNGNLSVQLRVRGSNSLDDSSTILGFATVLHNHNIIKKPLTYLDYSPMATSGSMSRVDIQELIDMIIDYLHDDQSSLASCALVAYQWVQSSRYHLFASVSLSGFRWIRFLDLLDSPYTTIPPHVRALELTDCHNELESLDEGIARLSNSNHLVAINSLSLKMIDWRKLSLEFHIATLLSSFQQIICLHLDHTSFRTEDDVVDLISSYPLLEELSMEDVLCDSSSVRVVRLPPSLRVLHVHLGAMPRMLVDVLSGRNRLCVLNTLGMSIGPDDITLVGLFLRDFGSQLRHLELWIRDGCSPDEICSGINLGHNTRLESIVINPFEWESLQALLNDDFFPRITSQIKSTFIESIEFTVTLLSGDMLSEWTGFSSLDQVLSRPQFAKLRRLLFRVWGHHFRYTRYLDAVKQGMPRCDERGILELEIAWND